MFQEISVVLDRFLVFHGRFVVSPGISQLKRMVLGLQGLEPCSKRLLDRFKNLFLGASRLIRLWRLQVIQSRRKSSTAANESFRIEKIGQKCDLPIDYSHYLPGQCFIHKELSYRGQLKNLVRK